MRIATAIPVLLALCAGCVGLPERPNEQLEATPSVEAKDVALPMDLGISYTYEWWAGDANTTHVFLVATNVDPYQAYKPTRSGFALHGASLRLLPAGSPTIISRTMPFPEDDILDPHEVTSGFISFNTSGEVGPFMLVFPAGHRQQLEPGRERLMISAFQPNPIDLGEWVNGTLLNVRLRGHGYRTWNESTYHVHPDREEYHNRTVEAWNATFDIVLTNGTSRLDFGHPGYPNSPPNGIPFRWEANRTAGTTATLAAQGAGPEFLQTSIRLNIWGTQPRDGIDYGFNLIYEWKT